MKFCEVVQLGALGALRVAGDSYWHGGMLVMEPQGIDSLCIE